MFSPDDECCSLLYTAFSATNAFLATCECGPDPNGDLSQDQIIGWYKRALAFPPSALSVTVVPYSARLE